jgi:hypothetical protein
MAPGVWLGFSDDFPDRQFLVVAQDTQVTELQREKAALWAELQLARGERDEARAAATWGSGAP